MGSPPLDPLFQWLFSLSGPSLKWDIETAEAFCAWLGQPQRTFAAVHVAGTNGKGSVAAMVHAMAGRSGLRAGLLTSPHLVRPEERIRIGDEEITPRAFAALIEELKEQADRALAAGRLPRHPSFFEMVCAAAFVAFAREPVALAVLETGLGGRLDATNVVFPVVSVITTIARDHIKSLGGSIASIAREKAGIIKPGIPVLVGWIDGEAEAIVRRVALRRGAPFHAAREELTLIEGGDGSFEVRTPQQHYAGLTCALAGAHQRRNAALALRAAELARERGVAFCTRGLRDGLAEVRWPGRLERLGREPEFLLDAAHNAEGIGALAEYLRGRARPERRVLLFGLTAGRPPQEVFAPLAGLVDAVVLTRPRSPKALATEEIAAAIAPLCPQLDQRAEVGAAIAQARRVAGAGGQVLVTGSLYLVGDVRRELLDLEGPWRRPAEKVPPLGSLTDHVP
ncbi:MAG TPA: bifunctional folylpolyglutamate synthase/dihydrofolate synthase [Acidobacteria bacterium]|nr:bifunctional folylpolyglutamate synthase/dihydrofolate synthase [Acidobacteriota bacterium]